MKNKILFGLLIMLMGICPSLAARAESYGGVKIYNVPADSSIKYNIVSATTDKVTVDGQALSKDETALTICYTGKSTIGTGTTQYDCAMTDLKTLPTSSYNITTSNGKKTKTSFTVIANKYVEINYNDLKDISTSGDTSTTEEWYKDQDAKKVEVAKKEENDKVTLMYSVYAKAYPTATSGYSINIKEELAPSHENENNIKAKIYYWQLKDNETVDFSGKTPWGELGEHAALINNNEFQMNTSIGGMDAGKNGLLIKYQYEIIYTKESFANMAQTSGYVTIPINVTVKGSKVDEDYSIKVKVPTISSKGESVKQWYNTPKTNLLETQNNTSDIQYTIYTSEVMEANQSDGKSSITVNLEQQLQANAKSGKVPVSIYYWNLGANPTVDFDGGTGWVDISKISGNYLYGQVANNVFTFPLSFTGGPFPDGILFKIVYTLNYNDDSASEVKDTVKILRNNNEYSYTNEVTTPLYSLPTPPTPCEHKNTTKVNGELQKNECGTETAAYTIVCDDCGAIIEAGSYIKSGDNHTKGKFIKIIKTATDTEPQVNQFECSKCGELFVEEYKVLPNCEHTNTSNFNEVHKKDQCGNETSSLRVICNDCGKIMPISENVIGNNHTKGKELAIITEATPAKKGVKKYICSVCGNQFEAEYEYEGTADNKQDSSDEKKADTSCEHKNKVTTSKTETNSIGVTITTVTETCGDCGEVLSSKTSVTGIKEQKKTTENKKIEIFKDNTPVTISTSKVNKLSKKKKAIKVSISKVSGANGYQIQYSTNKSFKKAKLKKITKTSVTIKKLKSKKKYYVRVRSYKKTGKTITYSKWSPTKTVKTK